MIDWESGYTSTWRIKRVHKSTWGDLDDAGKLDSFSMNLDGTDQVPKLQSSSATTTRAIGDDFDPGWYRVEMVAQDTSGRIEKVELATMNFESSKGNMDKGVVKWNLSGQSVLMPVAEAKMQAGEFINKGDNGAEWCYRQISANTPAPVVLEGSFTVDDYYVWGGGTSRLKAVWQVLDAAGWVMAVDGHGTITIKEKPKSVSRVIDAVNSGSLVPKLDFELDYSSVPNVYIAAFQDGIMRVENDDPESKVSTVSRGYLNEEYDDDIIRVNGETKLGYCQRKLEERSILVRQWTYKREFEPGVSPFDLVRFDIPGYIHSEMRVLALKFDFTYGALVEETLGEEIRLWIN